MLRRDYIPRRSRLLWLCLALSLIWNIRIYRSSASETAHSWNDALQTLSSLDNQIYSGSPWPLIPRKVWQTAADDDASASNALENSWHTLNPSWRYELLSDPGASTFVNETYGTTRPDIVNVYHRIETPILRVDLFRYLLLLHYGGLYADIDVDCKKPIDQWLPEDMRQASGMILGIEYDDDIHEDMPAVSLAQYVFVARPGHPILEAVTAGAIDRLKALGDQASPDGTARPGIISAATPQQILQTSGPYMFASIVFDYLKRTTSFKDISQLHHIQAPVRFGDVVILPINGFGWGQEHSRSGDLDMGERLVLHHFRRGWREPVNWGLDFSWRDKPVFDD